MSLRILVSNDDGYRAPGIAVLAEVAAEFGEVTVVAPERNRSGASNSLTLDRPLRVERDSNSGFHFVNGTPTDCVHVAMGSLLDGPPDLVVSGVNHGANLGDDVIYSGTVAAAMEGRLLGVPAIAFSQLWGEQDQLATARIVVREVLARYAGGFSPSTLLNVNIPPCAPSELRGYRVTRLGQRHKLAGVVHGQDPVGRDVYWIGPVGAAGDNGPETDFHAVAGNHVSLTPVTVDLTHDAEMNHLAEWLNDAD